MESPTDILVVARQDDGVATRLQEQLERRGRRVCRCDGMAAARLFTIRVSQKATIVTPASPMFVRSSEWWHDDAASNSDERFLRSEAYATFWAAAALSSAIVINSPGHSGPAGRLTGGAIGLLLDRNSAAGCGEIYASGPEMIPVNGDDVWGEDLNYLTAPISQLSPGTPIRARKLNPQALYEIVTVVGNRAFPATTDSRTTELNLIDRSVQLAKSAVVHFATITWVIDEGGALPVRLNAAPEEQELRYAWDDVAQALCEDLLR